MIFNGAPIADTVDISANGSRVRVSRDPGTITMDLDGIENVTFNALGGADVVTVHDLTGTDLTKVNVDLGGADSAVDQVIVNGTAGADDISVKSSGDTIRVKGLAARVKILNPEPTLDQLTVNALGGADIVNGSHLAAGKVQFIVNGGSDNDTITGSDGSDLINGGSGNDAAFLGAGSDAFIWNPGDGSDLVEGQGGTDNMLFNGANIAEEVNIAANGSRVRFTRDIVNITMDLNDVEIVTFNALGGADGVTVNDLTGTDLTRVVVNLAATGGGGDSAADTVTVNGTENADSINATGNANSVSVTGLVPQVVISGFENLDHLTINGLGGDDAITGAIAFTAKGGQGADVLVGGDNDDTLNGEDGDDVLIGNGGLDVLDGGTGSNTIIQ
jgi:Ca2+-binding RTX toxin-like protein